MQINKNNLAVYFLLTLVFLFFCFWHTNSQAGRSGYSGGSRGYSSSSFSRSYAARSGYSSARTGYSAQSRTGYVQSNNRSYTNNYSTRQSQTIHSSPSHTTVINNHTNHVGGGGGWFGGGGFWSGLLGGYIGGSLASNHSPVIVNGGAPVVASPGVVEPVMTPQPVVATTMYSNSGYGVAGAMFNFVILCCIGLLFIVIVFYFFRFISSEFSTKCKDKHW